MLGTRYAWSFAAVNLLWVTAAGGSPAAGAAPPGSAVTALHVDGAVLKDGSGKTILLRGINHHGFVDVPDGAWDAPGKPLFSGMGHWDPVVIKGALDDYRRLGFNVLRFHTVVEWWKENPRTYKDPWRTVTYPEPYRQMLKDTIQWAGERGLYVIFDFFAMKNVEGKQSGQETLPWPPYNRYPDVVGSREEFLAIWKSVAQELAPFPNVLFELYNEPNGDAKAEAEWFAFCEEALPAIRAYATNPVIIQWDYACWVNLDYPPPKGSASTLAWIERHPLKGDNIVYGTHLYRNSGSGGPGAIHRSKDGLDNLWEAEDVQQGLELALLPHTVRETKKPLLVTEVGAYLKYKGPGASEELSHELLWFKNTLAALNRWGVGYVDWAWQSDEHLDHGALHQGRPNEAGQIFLNSLKPLAEGKDDSQGDLEAGFRHPPDTARPWVYWFWLDGNITKEGITADLEAMQRVGLGGALWMWGGGVGEGVKGPVKFLNPQWWELMRHTVREADRLGLKINLTAGSGWSHTGGPWIKPEESMQRLELSQEIALKGPGLKEVTIGGGDPLVAVLGYRVNEDKNTMHKAGVTVVPSSAAAEFPVTKALDHDPATRWISKGGKAGDGPTDAHPEWLVFEFPNAYAAAGLYIAPFHDCGPRQCQLQVSKDGQEYQTICRFELAANTPQTIPFAAPASRFFRLLVTSAHPFQGQESWNVQVAEIQLLQQGEQPLEKELLETRSLVDLTSKLDSSGRLSWEVPPGAWTLQVFRHGSTGDQPHPILPDEGGLECDKLSPEAIEAHWNGYIRRVLDECGPAARRVIRWVHADSYEFGPQTWTPKLREEFKGRCGYDPLPYLPAIVGKVVDSPAVTERFLWDFRRVRADLFAEGVGGHLRELCQHEGVALTTEPHLVPEVFDQIQYGGHVSEPVGNFLGERRTAWYAANPPVGPEVHLAKGEASAAYTYGLDGVVWAEAFTGTDHAHAWKETPEYLKTWGDLWLTEGINRFCFHCWAHSPSLTQKPGITLGPWGIHFDRRNTWFDMATGYVSYLSRCQFMLQQGLPVMDVCMLTGDDVVAEFPRHPELRAAGYDYHGLTTDVLRKATVQDGFIVLQSRMRYRLLVTYSRELRPETMRRLRELVNGGATILGVKPEDAPGLAGYPASREEVRGIAEELWSSDEQAGLKGRAFGKGKVFWGSPERPVQGTSGCGVAAYLSCASELQVLRDMGVWPDFQYAQSGKENCDNMLAYMHRRMPGMDWYFVSNQAGRARKENCTFRLTGRQPELWDSVTGEMRKLPVFSEVEGRTVVPLEFAAGQSYFVVFRQAVGTEAAGRGPGSNFEAVTTLSELTGPWEVAFDPQWGGPREPVRFDALSDWAGRPEEGIKCYSGKAAYRKAFELSVKDRPSHVYLALGKVKDLAEVRLNGRNLGVVWCEPWRIEITEAVRTGENELEIVVANEWVNRLIGDSGQPPEKRITWTTWNPYKPNSPLLESGLLGPVTLQGSQ